MAPHSGILAWRIPWTEEPGGLQSMGLQRVGAARRAKIKANHHLNIVTLSSLRSPFKNGSKGRRWQFYL